MKKAKSQEEIKTIPHGCYECGKQPDPDQDTMEERMRLLTVDLQENGYPDFGESEIR